MYVYIHVYVHRYNIEKRKMMQKQSEKESVECPAYLHISIHRAYFIYICLQSLWLPLLADCHLATDPTHISSLAASPCKTVCEASRRCEEVIKIILQQ